VRLEEWIDRLLDANVTDYAISIHAARTETHKDLMGLRPGDFGRVVTAAQKLAARKREFPALSVETVLVVTRQNLAEIPEFIAMSERLGVDKVGPGSGRTPRESDELEPRSAQQAGALRRRWLWTRLGRR
jgi:MoaA/NifB/PqqE/SkfB family radical SAM enzyme